MDKRALTFLAISWCACTANAAPEPSVTKSSAPTKGVDISMYKKPNPEEIKRRLSREQYEVTQSCGTEPPFRNAYWNNHEAGIYVDVVSGEPLFSSIDKFDSGTGWPSFTKPLEPELVVEKSDTSHGMRRVEVKSKVGDSHLGHVFDDGPGPAGQRFCINSASLRFIPAAELAQEGYTQYTGLFPEVKQTVAATNTNQESVILAGGCFWGMEDIIRKIPGVISTEVGYSGGNFDNAKYTDVKTGRTGHAESVKVTFDPAKLSFAELLEKWFFKMHDPTTANRQGNDIGTQYRSAIFFSTDAQKKTAEEVKAKVEASGKWKRPIVTEIVAAGKFFTAEEYHQDYLEKNPGGYTCHFMRD